MSEVPWDSLFTVVGVTLGFALSQALDVSKSRTRKKLIRAALHHELEIARASIAKALPKSRLAFEDYPMITDSYDSLKIELASMLDPPKLMLVERAYHRIKALNSPITTYNPRGHVLIPSGGMDYQHDLNDDIKVFEDGIKCLTDK